MADVSGLILGTIALASLFKTCIELFDYFELGKNYAYDYQLACTKIALLKARLLTWGLLLRIEEPGEEHSALRQHWGDEHEVIGRSLFGIKAIFENASILAEKYRLTARRPRPFKSIIHPRGKEQQSVEDDTILTKASATSWAFLGKRTVWAIHDKQKFEQFIQDLSFLIENLEKVTERLAMPTFETKRKPVPTKPPPLSALNQQKVAGAHASSLSKENRKAPSHQPVQPPPRTEKHVHRDGEQLNVNKIASKLTGGIFTGNQYTDSGAVVMGSVGKSENGRHLFTGSQTATNNGFAVMGDVSAKAASRLQPSNHQQEKQAAALDDSDQSESEASRTSSEQEITRQDLRLMKLT